MAASRPQRRAPGLGGTFLLAAASLCLLPSVVAAQGAPSGETLGLVHPWARAGASATRLDGRGRTLYDVSAGLLLGCRFVLGGGGVVLSGPLPVARGASGPGFDLDLGYGGVVAGYRPLRKESWTATTAILLGAGHATATDRVVASNVEADNFFTAVPELSLLWRPLSWIGVSVGASYRLAAGVDDLPGVTSGALSGASLTMELHLGR